jgi:F-type H+-transporting ATPase subunit alpha
MKKVAGQLRIDLAQYRELLSFAQFGGDLDSATRDRLDRGERIVEVLKQAQYSPMPLSSQVAVIFAAVSGFLDRIHTDDIIKFERRFLAFLEKEYPQVPMSVSSSLNLDDDTEEALREALERFTREYTIGGAVG